MNASLQGVSIDYVKKKKQKDSIKILIFVNLDVIYGHPLQRSITLGPPSIHM